MTDKTEFSIVHSATGEMIIQYPDGSRDRTGIFSSKHEVDLMEAMGRSTAGRSLIMRMRSSAIHCSATKLLFREPARAMIQRQIERLSGKNFSGTVSVILMDLDHFGKVNKDYGVPAADRVLQWFADLLRRQTRGTDILVRWGGEEFVIFAASNDDKASGRKRIRDSGLTNPDELERLKTGTTMVDIKTVLSNGKDIASRICNATRSAPCMATGSPIPITVTLGVVSAYINNESATEGLFDTLPMEADKKLQAAKNSDNRNSVHVADLIRPDQPSDS